MTRFRVGVAIAVLVVAAMPTMLAGAAAEDAAARRVVDSSESRAYVVLYAQGATLGAARAAVRAAGGVIVKENAKVGVATVKTANAAFLSAVRGQRALAGAARNTPVGSMPADSQDARRQIAVRQEVERLSAERAASRGQASATAVVPAVGAEPLAALQWGNAMIRATVDGSYAVQRGDRRVLVGIMDTGVDGSHPDIAPNFSRSLSRNFTQDIELVDGPCADEPDQSCDDPADVDENGHGTHVAGIIGAALNGLGTAGVAPNVTLVNLRAGQDSGYFFLQPTVDALVYAGDIGVDVVNMSFYIDPWLYNCANNPADSPKARMEQRTIIAATQRALDYARARRVTLIGAAGNENTDLGRPTFDASSPDYPPGEDYDRTVDNTCLDMPTEGRGVMSIAAVGPTTMKADYSNYGVEQTTVAAPGGYYRDNFGTPRYATPTNLILAPYPYSLAVANAELNPDGTPNTPFVVRDCQQGVCAYYQYLQGTSMAAPYATGVVALIISQYGVQHVSGLTMNPLDTERILTASATDTPCPAGGVLDYPDRGPAYTAVCEGNAAFNGLYGNGIVDALRAVTYQRQWAR